MSATLIRQLFDTASVASILVLLVLGMAVIVGMMGVLNLCQGELILLGAVASYLSAQWFGTPWLGLLIAPVVVGAFGGALERLVVRRFYNNLAGGILATFAVGYIIREFIRSRMTAQGTAVAAPIDGSVSIGGAHVSAWRLAIIVLTVVVVVGCWFLLNRTALGLHARATLDNPELAAASGISTSRMYCGMFAFGSALAGFGGALIAPLQTLYPDLGLDNLVPMLIALMVGGMGSFTTPLLGALLIGIPFGFLPEHMSPVWAQLVVVLGAIVLIRLRPSGLSRVNV